MTPQGHSSGLSGADDFLSGTSGLVAGKRRTAAAVGLDALADAVELARLQGWRLRRAASHAPRRRVLAFGIERDDMPNLLREARAEPKGRNKTLVIVERIARFALRVVDAANEFLDCIVAADEPERRRLDHRQ